MLPDSALTKCPECQTVFSVDGEDLARAGGRVRCGDCLGIFDAIANALPVETAQPANAEPEETAAADLPAEGDWMAEPDAHAEHEETSEPASHTETASSLSWTLLEPIDAPDDDMSDAQPTQPTSGQDSHEDDSPSVSEFRFGDDTPPEMLEAELDALLDDDRSDSSEAKSPVEPDFDLTTTMSDVGDADLFDSNWDDLLNELDETGEPGESVTMTLIDDDSTEAPPLDFELADSDTAGVGTSVDLDLSRADISLSAPESIDALTLSTNTDYREAPKFDIYAADDDAQMPDAIPHDISATDDVDAEIEETRDSAIEEVAATGDADADDTEPDDPEQVEAEPDDTEQVEAGPDDAEQIEAEVIAVTIDAAEAPALDDEADSPAEKTEQLMAPASNDPAVADAEVEARLAAYHAALEATKSAPVETQEPAANDEDDVAFDPSALTDMFSAVDIMATGAEAAAADAGDPADDAQAPGSALDDNAGELTDGLAEDDAADAAAELADDSTDDAAQTPDDDQPEANEDNAAAAITADDVDEEGEEKQDTAALIAAMGAQDNGEVIVLSGDPDEFDESADAFAESMILSPDLAPAPSRWRLWSGLSAAAVLILGVQALHSYRGAIATTEPWGGYLASVYALFGQTLTPGWDATQMCVERSGGALGTDNQLDIETVFSNHGDKTMPMPVLKLRITDAYSDTLAGIIIQPRDYLPATDPRTQLRPGEQATAIASLDYAEPRLDGFEVSLCYPGEGGALRCAVRCKDEDARR